MNATETIAVIEQLLLSNDFTLKERTTLLCVIRIIRSCESFVWDLDVIEKDREYLNQPKLTRGV